MFVYVFTCPICKNHLQTTLPAKICHPECYNNVKKILNIYFNLDISDIIMKKIIETETNLSQKQRRHLYRLWF